MNPTHITDFLGTFSRFLTRNPHLVPQFEEICVSVRGESETDRMNRLWSQQDYILSHLPAATPEFYRENEDRREVEHQVGRYFGMRKIAEEIRSSRIAGDIVEFGSWQGTGLLILDQCFSSDPIQRRLIGIDSFQGLPEFSTVWKKGQFDDTSVELVRQNLASNLPSDRPFSLIQGWFSDPSVPRSLAEICQSIALVHFDADLASSTTQALAIIEPYLRNRTQPMYFLFDDWGCHQDEVPDAFLEWLPLGEAKYGLKATKIHSTRLTRYYRITFEAAPRVGKWDSP